MIINIVAIAVIVVLLIIIYVETQDRERGTAVICTILALMLGLNIGSVVDRLVGPGDGVTWNHAAYEAEQKCEASLPRDQNCTMTIVATPPKAK